MKINCIIVDDEPLARKGLSEYISDIDFLQLKASCENAASASKVLNEEKIDLIFLDIQMPKVTGFEFLKTLKNPPMVIITTAYTEYALQGYELDIMDYLLKPISFERFSKAVNKAKDFFKLKKNEAIKSDRKVDYFFIKCDNNYEKILFDDLLYAEALENYVLLHTKTKRLVSYLTFKAVENYLASNNFIKVHKSYIVSVDKIENITGNEIIVSGNSLPISRGLKDEVMNRIVNKNLLKR